MKLSWQVGVGWVWLSVCEGRAFLLGIHRRVYPDFLGRCPETFRSVPYDELSRRSIEELREMKANLEAPEGLGELPCGGFPTDENNVKCVAPGEEVPVSWRVETACNSKCKVTLMCPEKQITKVVWSGTCGAQPGDVEIRAKIPAESSSCESGKCFLQWKMESDKQKTYFGCIDLKIEQHQPADSETKCETPPKDTTSPSCTSTQPAPESSPEADAPQYGAYGGQPVEEDATGQDQEEAPMEY